MNRLALASLALCCMASTTALADPAADAGIAHDVQALMPRVAALRGLAFRGQVPILVETVDEIRARVLEESLDAESLAELEASHTMLRAFRLVPPGFDLRANVVDVLSEHVGGYYDPDTVQLVLVRRDGTFGGDGPADVGEEDMVAAHELVHALQDQHFDLWALRHRDHASADVDTAVLALVEGDASHAMLRWGLREELPGLATLDRATFHDVFVPSHADLDVDGALAAMPHVVRSALIFPYVEGTSFVHAVLDVRGRTGLDAAYGAPPLSTEHILHPDRWLAGDDPPLWPDLPDLSRPLGEGWNLAQDDALGELGIRALIEQQLPDLVAAAPEIAAGWGGDRYQVYRHDDGRHAAVWWTRWDSSADAADFERAMRLWPGAVAPELGAARKRFGAWWWRGRGTWRVHRHHADVSVLIDVPPGTVPDLTHRLRRVDARAITSLDQISTPRPEGRSVWTPTQSESE